MKPLTSTMVWVSPGDVCLAKTASSKNQSYGIFAPEMIADDWNSLVLKKIFVVAIKNWNLLQMLQAKDAIPKT